MPRYIVWVCTMNGAGRCGEKGGMTLLRRFKDEVKAMRLENVLVTPIGCTDRHADGPVVAVDPANVWYCHVTANDTHEILAEHVFKRRIVERLRCQTQTRGKS